MPRSAVNFFNEDVTYTLKNKPAIRAWINSAIIAEGCFLEELNFIFCSDEYLWRMNQQFLDHDTYTDVITFDNSERLKTINGDIFISIDRVKENASEINVPAATELCRVMIHGTLHLLGYKDKTKAAKTQMTAKEDHYLSLR
ncbi:MAG TPA: rRNA maturation RNase YbeY [Pedobacter sp.]|uniref:rRNA maturation RNase YbeY n=1 Tax=Pedobacter sp. TaxID=1411316 RepID=UPI002C818E86|nr:rRNA maturation RNase YbeY [Pedobacter sp.]HMI03914.1 rRNA maturation RNase YbeY [Pedobacter sp.]